MYEDQDWLLAQWQALADGYKAMAERGADVGRTEIVATPEFIDWMNSLDSRGRMMLAIAVDYAYKQGLDDADDADNAIAKP